MPVEVLYAAVSPMPTQQFHYMYINGKGPVATYRLLIAIESACMFTLEPPSLDLATFQQAIPDPMGSVRQL